MAYLWIHCFASAAEVAHGRPYQRQRIAVGAVSAQSAVIEPTPGLNGNPRARLFGDVDLQFEYNADPTADAQSEPMSAEQTEYREIPAGDKIAVIQRQA